MTVLESQSQTSNQQNLLMTPSSIDGTSLNTIPNGYLFPDPDFEERQNQATNEKINLIDYNHKILHPNQKTC